MDILRMVLTEFWPFVAACVLIGMVGNSVADVVRAWRKPEEP